MPNTKSLLLEQIEKLTAPVLQEHGAELVDLQFIHEHGQWVLRYFVDKEKGVTLDDCAAISEHVGRILDASDIIPQAYALEVSSPGINRPLRKESDYRRYIGERVDMTLYAPLNGRRHFKGVIQSVEPGIVGILDTAQQRFSLPIADVAKAKLDPEIEI